MAQQLATDWETRHIDAACSHERLEIYLWPRRALQYSLMRLRRSHSGAVPRPWMSLYVPPEAFGGALENAGPVFALGPACILLQSGTGAFALPLGVKIRDLGAGNYAVRVMARTAAGEETGVLDSRFRIREEDPDAEWLIPPRPVRVPAGAKVFVVLEDESGQRAYESAVLEVRTARPAPRHRYVLGRAGSRLIDLTAGTLLILAGGMPFAALTLWIRRRVARLYPDVAAARVRAWGPAALRFLAPAFYLDRSRWVLRGGSLEAGRVCKLETLHPHDKRPLLGSLSLFLRRWGIDEWPQIVEILSGRWALFGPRAVPNGLRLVAPGGRTVQDSRDRMIRYKLQGALRPPGVLSLRLAMTPRGSIELPPWRTMLLYDSYDSTHWSVRHAARVIFRLLLSFIRGEAISEHTRPLRRRVLEIHVPGKANAASANAPPPPPGPS